MSEQSGLSTNDAVLEALSRILPDGAFVRRGESAEIETSEGNIADIAGTLTAHGYSLAGIVVDWKDAGWTCRYPFYGSTHPGFIQLLFHGMEGEPIPSISQYVFSADWHEREVEDLFEIPFVDHPLLGDFVLHNEAWPEGIAPMRPGFSANDTRPPQGPRSWRPQRFVEAPGAFSMSVGPVYSGIAESAQFRLESEGEQIVHGTSRLFYKYRGLEKLVEGRSLDDTLLLAERMNGTAAVAHALALAQSAEEIGCVAPPPRAQALRVVFAELERLRAHASTVEDLVESTGLQVPTAMLSSVVEDLLRVSATASGHRYLFGLIRPGGVAADLGAEAAVAVSGGVREAAGRLQKVMDVLAYDNGFLDRVEEVGVLSAAQALRFGVVGPVGRASGLGKDLRAVHPYSGYEHCDVQVAHAEEGDAYARARVLVEEAAESARIIAKVLHDLPPGPVQAQWQPQEGSAIGWSEAPVGAAFHWLSLSADGTVSRWHAMPPSFANWPALATAIEGFAFQDFPIILASFGLSVAEADR